MRVSLRGLADLTNVNSMFLPELSPNLPGPVSYEGGLSGLAQAVCPSAQQLAGVQDCTDPCQASQPPCVSPSTAAAINATTLAQANSLAACSAIGGTWTSAGTCIAPTGAMSTQTVFLIGGGFLALMLLLMAAKR